MFAACRFGQADVERAADQEHLEQPRARGFSKQSTHLRQLSYAQLRELATRIPVVDVVRPDLDLLSAVGRLWGADSVKQFRVGAP